MAEHLLLFAKLRARAKESWPWQCTRTIWKSETEARNRSGLRETGAADRRPRSRGSRGIAACGAGLFAEHVARNWHRAAGYSAVTD
jgi:hypothetical protein